MAGLRQPWGLIIDIVGSDARDLVLGTLGIAALAVFVRPLWDQLSVFMYMVRKAQAEDVDQAAKHVFEGPMRRRIIVIVLLVAAPAVGLSMATALTSGVSPESTLKGAILASLSLLWIEDKSRVRRIAVLSVAAMLYLLTEAGPLSQAGAIALASWFLLLAGAREAVETVGYYWTHRASRDDPFVAYIPLPAPIWSALFLAYAMYALIVGSRALLQWPASGAV